MIFREKAKKAEAEKKQSVAANGVTSDPASESKRPKETEETVDSDLDDVDRQLEEAVEATYKPKTKSKAAPKPVLAEDDVAQEDDSMDMDELDRHLDMALEGKTKVN